MADPCGCTPNNSLDPNAPLTPPEGTSHAYGSIPCPVPAKPCFTPLCDDRFQTLPKAKRIEVIGTNGKCMYKLDPDQVGLVATDGKGGFVVSNAPNIDLQQLVSYATGPNGLILDSEKRPIEDFPPEFPYLIVQLADGSWRKVRGRPGSVGLVMWNDDGFHVLGVDDSNILISRPEETAEFIELIGFDTDDCLAEGERNNLVRLTSTFEGVAFFNPTTNKFTVTTVCELFDDIGNLTGVPFLLACSGGNPIRFKGTSPSVLIWDTQVGAFSLIAADEKACDPTCGCSTELSLIYNCATNSWKVSEPEVHVLSFKNYSDTGPNASVEFTLPWPAMLTVYAARRFTPQAGSLDVHKCNIYVDGFPATSASDGGMVARLDQATTNTGVAVVPVKKGSHTAYISDSSTTNDVTPIWSGAWIKVVAHKIAECDPDRPTVGGGTIRTAFGGDGEECDCPPGPEGPPGADGNPGPEGPPGPTTEGGCPSGSMDVAYNFYSEDVGIGGVQLFGAKKNIFFDVNDETDECEFASEDIEPPLYIGPVLQSHIPAFSIPVITDLSFVGAGEDARLRIVYSSVSFDGLSFSLQPGDVGLIPVPCSCSD